MTCYLYSSVKTALKLCGHRCNDIKSFLLSNNNSDENYLLQKIFEKLYFNEIPEDRTQKKCIIKFDRDILTDTHIQLFALLEGDNNLEFQVLFHQSKNCETTNGICSSKFGSFSPTNAKYGKRLLKA